MRITIYVSGYYDWEPVPAHVDVTPEHIASGQVKPSANGGHTVRVPKKFDTHVDVLIAENQIIQQILHSYCESNKCGTILTRQQAMAKHIATYAVPATTHRKWMKHIEVYDDGPNEELFRAILAPHLEADHGRAPGKNVEAEDVDELVAAYLSCPKVEPLPALTANDDRAPAALQKYAAARAHRNKAHADHLHEHFKIKSSSPSAAPAEGSQ